MFHITFSPQRADDRPTVAVLGDTLIIDGQTFDFSPLPEGGTIPASATGCDILIGDVERIGGLLRVHMLLKHGNAAPRETTWPEPLLVEQDGGVDLPPFDAPSVAEDLGDPDGAGGEAEDDGQGELDL